ncbi:MAG TPA: hypothetical protein VN671_06670, partial [Solirubrobacterales bacterium]|nr:hypothetical protein [Solirubrobacterales bacterium]
MAVPMTSRQVIVGFCATCALLFSLAAAGTAGAQTAATAYECSPTAMTLEFNDADCTTKGGLGSYGHKEIPRVTKTNLRLSAEATFVLKTTDGGVILTLTAGEVDAEVAAGGEPAWIENVQNMTGR